jgi:hypothetical protein
LLFIFYEEDEYYYVHGMIFQDKSILKIETEIMGEIDASNDNLLPPNFGAGVGRIFGIFEEAHFAFMKIEVSCYAAKATHTFEVCLKIPIRIPDIKQKYSLMSLVTFQGQLAGLSEGKLLFECKRLPQFIKATSESRTIATPSRKPLKGKTSVRPPTTPTTPVHHANTTQMTTTSSSYAIASGYAISQVAPPHQVAETRPGSPIQTEPEMVIQEERHSSLELESFEDTQEQSAVNTTLAAKRPRRHRTSD